MENKFWLERWQKSETGFHRDKPHALLSAHWKSLNLPIGSSVFVPLCGKSSDMIWLAEQGHRVIGSELSPIAIDDFFSGVGLSPKQTASETDGLILESSGPYEIWQGDVFSLSDKTLKPISAVYDRAALVALPADMQVRYADLLSQLMPPKAKLFLISLEYDDKEMDGPPFSTPADRVEALFSTTHAIKRVSEKRDALSESDNLAKRGLTQLTESLFILTRKPH